MSLAAGVVARVYGQRDDGPATCRSTHAEQRSGNLGRAWQERRTAAYVEQAPPIAHLLEVLEELRRPLVGSRTRPARIWPCAQNLSQCSRTTVLAKECRDSASRAALRFERVADCTLRGDLSHDISAIGRLEVRRATLIAAELPSCFSSEVPQHRVREPCSIAGATAHPCLEQPCRGVPAEIMQVGATRHGERAAPTRATWHKIARPSRERRLRPLKSHDLVSPSCAGPYPRLAR